MLKYILLGVTITIMTVGGIYIRITRVDATEMRLLVDYWPFWTLCMIAMLFLLGWVFLKP